VEHIGRYIWWVVVLLWFVAPLVTRLVRAAGRSAAEPRPAAVPPAARRPLAPAGAPPRPRAQAPRPALVPATPRIAPPPQPVRGGSPRTEAGPPLTRPHTPRGRALLGALLTPGGMSQAVVAAELLRPPVALRRPDER
jgi:hypothetical protein